MLLSQSNISIMFAIVEIAGKQYKVSENDTVEVDKLNQPKGKITLDKVLLYAKDEKTVELGHPYIENAHIDAEVVEEKKGEKIRVFKMKPKKRYSKTIGHRRNLTVLSIKSIKFSEKKDASKKTSKKLPKETSENSKTVKKPKKETEKKVKTANNK